MWALLLPNTARMHAKWCTTAQKNTKQLVKISKMYQSTRKKSRTQILFLLFFFILSYKMIQLQNKQVHTTTMTIIILISKATNNKSCNNKNDVELHLKNTKSELINIIQNVKSKNQHERNGRTHKLPCYFSSLCRIRRFFVYIETYFWYNFMQNKS